MNAIQFQAMALETERRRQLELQHINVALKRIKIDYGKYQICGEDIKAKRLEIDPCASICIDYAK